MVSGMGSPLASLALRKAWKSVKYFFLCITSSTSSIVAPETSATSFLASGDSYPKAFSESYIAAHILFYVYRSFVSVSSLKNICFKPDLD